ncbi:MAG: L-serine ammonia-lyase, iron-sulfur-dependent, subunit alpha [Promethearchaeota archaeon]
MFESISEMFEFTKELKLSLHEAIIQREIEYNGGTKDQVIERLNNSLSVMRESLDKSIEIDVILPIREAMEQSQKLLSKPYFLSADLKEAVYWAMSIAEYNSGMGKICAAPTAGSCGVFPATIFKAQQMLKKSNEKLLNAFIVGSAIGLICGNRATISGSEGGCQAEVGIASAMASSAITYLALENIDENFSEKIGEKISNSVAIALKNLLGLVCDPVAGLVISPCIKRNAIGVVNAFLAAEMALSGVESVIPADEVIDALYSVGKRLPPELKETGQGGIANTPTGKKITKSLFEID